MNITRIGKSAKEDGLSLSGYELRSAWCHWLNYAILIPSSSKDKEREVQS
jgi:hypothetical protein